MALERRVARLDWAALQTQLDQEGHALVPALLDDAQVGALASRGTGQGALFESAQPWPPFVAELQAAFHAQLLPIANRWNALLGRSGRHPGAPAAFPAPQLSRLQAGEYQPLHQAGDGAHGFALQLVALLSTPGEDFAGGAFVMTEQRPRMQSRPMVLPLRRGDVAIIAVAQRPHAGAKGIYAVNLRHAVSRVHGGTRLGLELLFHAA